MREVYSDLLLSWRFTSTKTIGLIRDGRMEVGEEGDYIAIATLSPPEWFRLGEG